MFATEATRKVAARFHRSALRRTSFLLLRLLDAMAVHAEAQDTVHFALLLSLLANLALIVVTAPGPLCRQSRFLLDTAGIGRFDRPFDE
jgi:hypothetical protein